MILRRNRYEDFVLPVLRVLDGLGGEAWLHEVEDEFYRHYAEHLDPAEDWHTKTPNHKKELWRDHCGSRVAWHHLTPENYIAIERHGSNGSIWRLTAEGRARLQSQEP